MGTLVLIAAVVVLTVLAVGAVLLFGGGKPQGPTAVHAAPSVGGAPADMARALYATLAERDVSDAAEAVRRQQLAREIARLNPSPTVTSV